LPCRARPRGRPRPARARNLPGAGRPRRWVVRGAPSPRATRARCARRSGSVRGCRWTLRAPPWRSSVEFPASGRRTRPPGAARRGRGAPTARAPGQCTPPAIADASSRSFLTGGRSARKSGRRLEHLKGSGRGAMVRWVNVRRCVLGIALSSMVAGCGATRSSADNPTSFGGLTPNTPDMEAGLVAIAPGFDIRTYKAVVVEKFEVTDAEIQDEGDRRFAAKMTQYLHLQLLRRLCECGLF